MVAEPAAANHRRGAGGQRHRCNRRGIDAATIEEQPVRTALRKIECGYEAGKRLAGRNGAWGADTLDFAGLRIVETIHRVNILAMRGAVATAIMRCRKADWIHAVHLCRTDITICTDSGLML